MRMKLQIPKTFVLHRDFEDATGRLAWMWRKKASWTITARTANMQSAATTANLFHRRYGSCKDQTHKLQFL